MHHQHKITIFLLFLSAGLGAQQELMLSSLPDLWHSNSINPAFYPEGKRFFIGVPALSLDIAHSGELTYNDLFREEGDRTYIDLSQAIDKLEPENELFYQQRIETVSLGLRSRDSLWGLQLGHAILLNAWVKYPKSLAQILWYGNAPFVGQTLQIGPQTDAFDWHEWSVGVSRQVGNFSLGARLKYLTGMNLLRTDDGHTELSVYTDPDIYQLTLRTDYQFYSSSLVESFDTSGYGYDINAGSFGGSPSTKNSGFAFDLGLHAKLSERLSVYASALNLGGAITWKKDVSTFTSRNEYTYNGAEIAGLDIINGSDNLDFDAQLDTLNDIFKFVKTGSDNLKNDLPMRIYAGGSFDLSEKWSVSLNTMYETLNSRDNTAAGAGIRWEPLRWLSLGAMYSTSTRSSSNLGFHLILQPGPVQVYLTSDNLLNGFSAKSSPAANFRVGGALVF